MDRKRILVADDEESIVKFVSRILGPEYEAVAASSGDGARSILDENRVGVEDVSRSTRRFNFEGYWLDNLMGSGPTGLELTRYIREQGDRSPIVIYSSSLTEQDFVGLENVFYLKKPCYNFAEMEAKADEAFEQQ